MHGRKKSEHMQGRTNRRRLVFYPTIQLVIVNLYTKYELSVLYSCGDILDLRRKIWRERKGKTNRRRLILNPTIQLVIVNLNTEYEVSILNRFGDIFDEKVLRKDGRTDGQMQTSIPPLFRSGGIYQNICPT